MDVDAALEKLRELLPLTGRLKRLPPAAVAVHRATLVSFVQRGRPLFPEEISTLAADGDAESALALLAREDLMVRGPDGATIEGAYPFTTVRTPHRLTVNGNRVHAMCALDALAVSPMSGFPVVVDSVCSATGAPVRVVQRGREIVEAAPSERIQLGIGWAATGGSAARHL